jgi:hypothetical protein
MKTKFFEVTTDFNYGKFAVCQWEDDEWSRPSVSEGIPMLIARGWDRHHYYVMDLQTGEGAWFRKAGLASYDLDKHQIWVCPMFEPFLEWVYAQPNSDIETWPSTIHWSREEVHKHEALSGYRRPGPIEYEEIIDKVLKAMDSAIDIINDPDEMRRQLRKAIKDIDPKYSKIRRDKWHGQKLRTCGSNSWLTDIVDFVATRDE